MKTIGAISHIQPYVRGQTVTASDYVDLPYGTCDDLYVGKTGIVVGIFADDTTMEFDVCTQGKIYPFAFKRIKSTTTNASSMVALYYARGRISGIGGALADGATGAENRTAVVV